MPESQAELAAEAQRLETDLAQNGRENYDQSFDLHRRVKKDYLAQKYPSRPLTYQDLDADDLDLYCKSRDNLKKQTRAKFPEMYEPKQTADQNAASPVAGCPLLKNEPARSVDPFPGPSEATSEVGAKIIEIMDELDQDPKKQYSGAPTAVGVVQQDDGKMIVGFSGEMGGKVKNLRTPIQKSPKFKALQKKYNIGFADDALSEADQAKMEPYLPLNGNKTWTLKCCEPKLFSKARQSGGRVTNMSVMWRAGPGKGKKPPPKNQHPYYYCQQDNPHMEPCTVCRGNAETILS